MVVTQAADAAHRSMICREREKGGESAVGWSWSYSHSELATTPPRTPIHEPRYSAPPSAHSREAKRKAQAAAGNLAPGLLDVLPGAHALFALLELKEEHDASRPVRHALELRPEGLRLAHDEREVREAAALALMRATCVSMLPG